MANTSGFRSITLEDIRSARELLKNTITLTPVRKSPPHFTIAGTEIWLKLENEQLTGSFKIRGAMNKMSSLTADERKRGVVLSSAGNHAQGVAYAAKLLGVSANIVMPLTTPIVKVNATRSYGANVILHGEFYDEAFAYAKELEKEKGYIFVHAFDDSQVIAGQGTLGLEILEQIADLDSIIVPIGGGGLISGIASAAKALKPSIRIIGVVSDQAPAMMNLKNGEAVTERKKRIATIAEGIAVKNPSYRIYETYISKLVDQIVQVEDNEVAQAIVFLMEKAKTVTEGAGAAGFAALMSKGETLSLGAKTCVVLCGGNIDLNVMSKVIERGLRQEHRLARMTVVADDLPGNLQRITSIMAEHRANILEVYHDRVSAELGIRETRIDLLVETASEEHIQKIKATLKDQGFKVM
ncbi:MAG: threonine ammonia-lyase [Proteobacteria bacterium]|nr:MAG: threonine ammonia-lyase [Pseudomonadota bacterium]